MTDTYGKEVYDAMPDESRIRATKVIFGNDNVNEGFVSSTNPLPTSGVLTALSDNNRATPLRTTFEGHLEVAVHSPIVPFGAMEVASLDPILQDDAVYGLNSKQIFTDAAGGGSAGASGNLFICRNGNTTIGSYGALQSRERLRYRAGQGLICRFSALFESGYPNVVQVAGMGNPEDGFYFGMSGTTMGILHSRGGVREIQHAQLTVGAAGTEWARVTLNGVEYNTRVTAGSTVLNAYQISTGNYPGWTAMQVNSGVYFLSSAVGNKTSTFTLAASGAGTLAGNFTETISGQPVVDSWVPQSDWDEPCDGSGPTGFNLRHNKGNIYQIAMQYLGFGPVVFSIEGAAEGNNPDFVNAHTLMFQNTRDTVTITQPAFPFTMSTANVGTAGGVSSTKVGSFAAFLAGKKGQTALLFSYHNNVTSNTSNLVPLFTVRNDRIYQNRASQATIELTSIAGGANGNATALTMFHVIRNAELIAGNVNFTRYGTDDTCSSVDKGATVCTYQNNSQLLWSTAIPKDGAFEFAFNEQIILQPGETVTVAVEGLTATAACVAVLNTREEH